MKSELHSKDRYEVAEKIPTVPLTKKEKYLSIAFALFLFIGIPLINYLIHTR